VSDLKYQGFVAIAKGIFRGEHASEEARDLALDALFDLVFAEADDLATRRIFALIEAFDEIADEKRAEIEGDGSDGDLQ